MVITYSKIRIKGVRLPILLARGQLNRENVFWFSRDGFGMIVDPGTDGMLDAAAEIGTNPVSKHQIQPEYGDEQADAGRDCRNRLARPDFQARTRIGKKYPFYLVS